MVGAAGFELATYGTQTHAVILTAKRKNVNQPKFALHRSMTYGVHCKPLSSVERLRQNHMSIPSVFLSHVSPLTPLFLKPARAGKISAQ
jgi:hypothetical protein